MKTKTMSFYKSANNHEFVGIQVTKNNVVFINLKELKEFLNDDIQDNTELVILADN